MEKLVIVANFHLFAAGLPGQPERRVSYLRGMVVDASEMPEGHTAEEWVAKGLAKAA